MAISTEINLDGLVGPTHHYAGLSPGNLASERHAQSTSNPRAAALQGLDKMSWLISQGIPQGVLPPQMRPNFQVLHNLGFRGTPQKVLSQLYKKDPDLLSMCCSASAMWAANAATVAPSCDTANRKVCITPANLVSNFHRSMEADATERLFRYIFSDSSLFEVNKSLPAGVMFSDEGAANHMRITSKDMSKVQHVFVYGEAERVDAAPKRFPARQSRQASAAVARLNHLPDKDVFFIQQLPSAIDKGVFHNDVIALSHTGLLLCHEHSFVDQKNKLNELKQVLGNDLCVVEVSQQQLPIKDAVSSYLFNSQIVSCGSGETKMLLPMECFENAAVKKLLEDHIKPQANLTELKFVDLQQSMRNGGGPACLRLRMNLTEQELGAMGGRLMLDPQRIQQLKQLVARLYPDQLSVRELSSWEVVRDLIAAVEAVYDFLELPKNLLLNSE